MPSTNVHTASGHVYKYYPPPTHTNHDDQFSAHHDSDHDSDSDPDVPLTAQVIDHKPTDGNDGQKEVSVEVKATVEDPLHAMVVLKGRLGSGEFFMRCINQNNQVPPNTLWDDAFWIDASGNISANDIYSFTTDDINAYIEELGEDIDANADILETATQYGDPGTLAKRNATGDCTFHTVTAEHVHVVAGANDTSSLDLYGDASMRYLPYIEVAG